MKPHKHTGTDSPRIAGTNIDGLILDDEAMHTENAETVADVKTFSSIPALPASNPTADNELVRKKYVDDNIIPKDLEESESYLVDSADTERAIPDTQSSYTKDKDVTINEVDGSIRVKFDLKDDNGAGGCFGRVYKNRSPVGVEREETAGGWETYDEVFEVNEGDEIQLYTKYDNGGGGVGGATRNFRTYYKKAIVPVAGTINLD